MRPQKAAKEFLSDEQSYPPPNRILWLDAAKCAAFFAVLLNHSDGFLYKGELLFRFSVCCIPLFVIISGMTSYLSNQKSRRTWLAEFLHSSKPVFAAYALALLVYQIAEAADGKDPILFDFDAYLRHLFRFDSPLLFYYVFLYLQLMLTSRFLYRCIEGFPERYRLVCEAAGSLLLLCFASFSVQHTNMFGLWGGGGKLFGGTCLFLYYLGMLLMKHGVFSSPSRKKSLLIVGITTPLLGLWLALFLSPYAIDAYFPFGDGYNPPGVSASVLALLVLFWVYGAATLLQTVPGLRRCVEAAAFVGRHTLYLYLYHVFLFQYLFYRIPYIPFTVVTVCSAVVLLPIAWEYAVHAVCRFFRRLQRLDA